MAASLAPAMACAVSRPRSSKTSPIATLAPAWTISRAVAAPRVDELRQERKEEEKELRVEQVGQQTLAIGPRQRPPSAGFGSTGDPGEAARQQPGDAEIDEIGGAAISDDRKGERRIDEE